MINFTVKHSTTTHNNEATTMKTTTKRATRRLAASLAIITALVTGGAYAADLTVSENTTLTEDMTVDALTVDSGVTLDRADHLDDVHRHWRVHHRRLGDYQGAVGRGGETAHSDSHCSDGEQGRNLDRVQSSCCGRPRQVGEQRRRN